MKPPQTCSLLISTYNWPRALKTVLESVLCQTRLPNEILIADDGSGPETRELIDAFRTKMSCPIRHVWQEDKGFRKCIVLNRAIALVTSEYIVEIDGDCVLSPHFIEDHLAVARMGWFTCGSRVLLTRDRTEQLLASEKPVLFGVFSAGIRNRSNALRIPWLSRLLLTRYHARKSYIAKGCNMAFWTRDILAVNGYNESISGWGREDAEIEVRLIKLGLQRQTLKFAGIQFHLFHEENDRSRDVQNLEILKKTLESPEFRTPFGIEKD